MRKRHSQEYKDELVKLVIEQQVPAAQAARDHGVGYSTLEKWIREFKQRSVASNAVTADERAELLRLRKENYQLRMERDVLKKTALLFAKDTEGSK